MHYKGDGSPKKPVGVAAAKRMRAEGWDTYLCPICGKTHASKKGTERRGARKPDADFGGKGQSDFGGSDKREEEDESN